MNLATKQQTLQLRTSEVIHRCALWPSLALWWLIWWTFHKAWAHKNRFKLSFLPLVCFFFWEDFQDWKAVEWGSLTRCACLTSPKPQVFKTWLESLGVVAHFDWEPVNLQIMLKIKLWFFDKILFNKHRTYPETIQGVPSLNPKRIVKWHPETKPFDTQTGRSRCHTNQPIWHLCGLGKLPGKDEEKPCQENTRSRCQHLFFKKEHTIPLYKGPCINDCKWVVSSPKTDLFVVLRYRLWSQNFCFCPSNLPFHRWISHNANRRFVMHSWTSLTALSILLGVAPRSSRETTGGYVRTKTRHRNISYTCLYGVFVERIHRYFLISILSKLAG